MQHEEPRFDYAMFRTRERAELALEDMFSAGDVCAAERPRVERRGDRFAITLPC